MDRTDSAVLTVYATLLCAHGRAQEATALMRGLAPGPLSLHIALAGSPINGFDEAIRIATDPSVAKATKDDARFFVDTVKTYSRRYGTEKARHAPPEQLVKTTTAAVDAIKAAIALDPRARDVLRSASTPRLDLSGDLFR